MGRVRLDHHRTAGRQRGRGVAAGDRERQWEIAGAEHSNRTQPDQAHAQIGPWRLPFGQRAIDASILPGTFAQQVGEQFQLTDGAAAFAFEPCSRQTTLGHRAHN